MAAYDTLRAAIDSYIKANGNKEITGTVLNDILNAMVSALGADTRFAGVAVPTTNPGNPEGNVVYFASQAGTYTNFGNIAVTEGITILKHDGSNWSKEQISYSDGVFDISAYNGTSYADLSAALGTNGANIPENLRKGGMSVKFVQSSDNNYIQARLMANTFTADAGQWQVVDKEPNVGSKNLIDSNGVFQSLSALQENSMFEEKTEITNSTRFSGYAGIDGKFNYNSGAAYGFNVYPVEKKKKYIIKDRAKGLSADFAAVLFSEDYPEQNLYGKVLDVDAQHSKAYQEISFTAPSDGYISLYTQSSDGNSSIWELSYYKEDFRNLLHLLNNSPTTLEKKEVVGTFVSGLINNYGWFFTNSATVYGLYYYPVSKGKVYEINIHYSDNNSYTSVAFSTSVLSNNSFVDDIIQTDKGNSGSDAIRYYASNDGYIYVYKPLNTSIPSLSEIVFHFVGASWNDVVGLPIALNAKYSQMYIATNLYVRTISSQDFQVSSFPVEEGKSYLLYGDDVRLNSDFPLAVFAESALAANVECEVKILDGHNSLASYNTVYTAPADGYIFVASISGIATLQVYSIDKGDEGVNRLEQTHGIGRTINVQFFGDSITDQVSYPMNWVTFLHNFLNYELTVRNDAVGGSGIYHGKSPNANHDDLDYNYILDLLNTEGILKDDNDLIIVLCGTNDWAGPMTQLGEITDDVSGSTFYACVKRVVTTITTRTKSKLILCTPPQRYNSTDEGRSTNDLGEPLNANGKTLRQYANAIVEVGNLYGIDVVNLNAILGWNKFNVRNFTYDGLHPNKNGAKWISKLMAKMIEEHCSILPMFLTN